MVVASFVVAVVALTVSGIAAYSAFRSSRAARQVAQRDADRRHDERTPQWDFTIDTTPGTSGRHVLRGRLTSSEAVDSVRVEITEADGVSFTNGQDGVAPDVAFPVKAEGGPVAGGAAAVWRVAISAGPKRPVRLTVRSTRGADDPWETPAVAEAPGDITASTW